MHGADVKFPFNKLLDSFKWLANVSLRDVFVPQLIELDVVGRCHVHQLFGAFVVDVLVLEGVQDTVDFFEVFFDFKSLILFGHKKFLDIDQTAFFGKCS